MNALLLSAGLGTRFLPITNKIAKPTIPFLNVPLMGYTLFYLEKLGLKNLVLNTHHLPKIVQSVTECLTHQQLYKINFSHEPEILGSGGGIKQAEQFLRSESSNDFIVANADEVIFFSHDSGLTPLVEFHKKSGALATLLTTKNPEAGKSLGGVWVDKNQSIIKLGGLGTEPNAQHFTGVYVFSPKVFSYMPAGGNFHIFKDCLHKALAAGEKIMAFYDDQLVWLDHSSEKDYIRSTRSALKILNSQSPQSENLKNILAHFHQDVKMVAPRKWLAGNAKYDGSLEEDIDLFMGHDSVLQPGASVRGFAVLGANAIFGPGYMEDSVIAPNIHINDVISLRSQIVV